MNLAFHTCSNFSVFLKIGFFNVNSYNLRLIMIRIEHYQKTSFLDLGGFSLTITLSKKELHVL